jgi:hypothetical protein
MMVEGYNDKNHNFIAYASSVTGYPPVSKHPRLQQGPLRRTELNSEFVVQKIESLGLNEITIDSECSIKWVWLEKIHPIQKRRVFIKPRNGTPSGFLSLIELEG